jgi:hypothetical protein
VTSLPAGSDRSAVSRAVGYEARVGAARVSAP